MECRKELKYSYTCHVHINLYSIKSANLLEQVPNCCNPLQPIKIHSADVRPAWLWWVTSLWKNVYRLYIFYFFLLNETNNKLKKCITKVYSRFVPMCHSNTYTSCAIFFRYVNVFFKATYLFELTAYHTKIKPVNACFF